MSEEKAKRAYFSEDGWSVVKAANPFFVHYRHEDGRKLAFGVEVKRDAGGRTSYAVTLLKMEPGDADGGEEWVQLAAKRVAERFGVLG
jgi:hypothetical protein